MTDPTTTPPDNGSTIEQKPEGVELESLERILDIAVGSAEADARDWENRAFKRRECDGWIAMISVDANGEKSEPVTMRSEDLSPGGIGTYSWHEVPAGSRGVMMIRRSAGEHVLLGAKVVYCRPRSARDYRCGIQFSSPPPGVSIDDFREEGGALIDLGKPMEEG